MGVQVSPAWRRRGLDSSEAVALDSRVCGEQAAAARPTQVPRVSTRRWRGPCPQAGPRLVGPAHIRRLAGVRVFPLHQGSPHPLGPWAWPRSGTKKGARRCCLFHHEGLRLGRLALSEAVELVPSRGSRLCQGLQNSGCRFENVGSREGKASSRKMQRTEHHG